MWKFPLKFRGKTHLNIWSYFSEHFSGFQNIWIFNLQNQGNSDRFKIGNIHSSWNFYIPNDFEAIYIVFKNIHFSMKKRGDISWHYEPFLEKTIFFLQKIDFFKDDKNKIEFKIFWIVKQDPKAGTNTIGYVFWKFKELWKNWFFRKNMNIKKPIDFFNII